jgi:hypothetical protein
LEQIHFAAKKVVWWRADSFSCASDCEGGAALKALELNLLKVPHSYICREAPPSEWRDVISMALRRLNLFD